ncbi:MAG: hypothetical protein FJ316_06775 [SAR202 cluster bacterium]|nr:hypothetical protein [SAR202 cluster bacterium]
MHHWEVEGTVHVGWPDYDSPEKPYTIVEYELMGKVFRARVTNGQKQGGFLVIYDCPREVLERLADRATERLGFQVVVSNLRCSVDGTVYNSFDYEWHPTPEFAARPSLLARTIADLLAVMQEVGEA